MSEAPALWDEIAEQQAGPREVRLATSSRNPTPVASARSGFHSCDVKRADLGLAGADHPKSFSRGSVMNVHRQAEPSLCLHVSTHA